jgi:subtilisin-like proprotein convertase family protein
MKKIIFSAIVLMCYFVNGYSQTFGSYFQSIDISTKPNIGEQQIKTNKQQYFSIDLISIKNYLLSAPLELTQTSEAITYALELPMPDGTTALFDMEESPMLDGGLASQYPNMKTYTGKGITHRSEYLKLSITEKGLHVMILSETGTIYMDPYNQANQNILVVYHKKDFNPQGKTMNCGVGDNTSSNTIQTIQKSSLTVPTVQFGDCVRRNYRLALAATAEYTTFHGGTVNAALAAMVVTMNRVNGVYEKDLGVHMNLVANTNLLIYTNATTDPYSNTNPANLLTQNQANCDAVIGNANYDLGHVFSTGGGGLSGLGIVCNSTQKARSETGSSAPVGDAYDIDYVAHEIGHQFSGNHTFNATTGSCGGGNINNGTAVETGSGITIMAYAGICSPNDIATNSIDNFHSTSLAEMSNFITGSATCATTQSVINNTPVITSYTTNKNIPKSTPFMLTTTATDVDGDALTYAWEQIDNQVISNVPVATNTGGPMFRCFSPSTNPTWYFPRLDSIVNNTPLKWEVLPSVARTMNFRLTVRDNHSGNGCTSSANNTLTVDANSGPFVVTAPNTTGLSFAAFSTQTVTWNVANTTASPVNCANVDILLSTDGGLTYPITLLTGTPNDGSQTVTIPNITSSTARIIVKANANIFFDISNNNFVITAPLIADYTLTANPTTQSVCVNNSAEFTVNTTSILGYTGIVNLAVTGLPNGANASFNPSSVTPGGSSTLTISGLTTAGVYNLTVNGTSQSSNQNAAFTINVFGNAGNVTLNTPITNSNNVSTTPTLNWTVATNATSYDLLIATNNSFTAGLQTINNILTNSFTFTGSLTPSTKFFWKVRALNNCDTGSYSSVYSFTTANIICSNFMSTDVPKTIAALNANNITSIINIPNNGNILDLNVIGVKGTHSYVSDLVFMLKSPANSIDTLVSGICGSNVNYSFSFDDASSNAYSTIPCPPTDSNSYQPLSPLSIFNGANINGTWSMMVNDLYAQDGGNLNSWGLRVCYTPICNIVPTVIVSNPNCPNNCTASAAVIFTGGVSPVTYAWTNTAQTAATVTNLCNNSYAVTITDAQGCTASANAAIADPANPSNVVTTSPANNVTLTSTSATFTWNASANSTSYQIEVSTNIGFTNIVSTASNITTTTYTTQLSANTTYYWRVRGVNNCGNGNYSSIKLFNTPSIICNNYMSTDVPKTISSVDANNIISLLNITGLGIITDVDVISLKGTHSYVSDLLFMLKSPNNIIDTLLYSVCGSNTNFNIGFDDASVGNYASIPCPPTDSNAYQPYSPLSIYNGGSIAGAWTLMVNDLYAQDGGSVDSWGLRVCYTTPCSMNAFVSTSVTDCSNNGTATAAAIGGTGSYSYLWSNGQTTSTANNLAAGTYSVLVTDGIGCTATTTATIIQTGSIPNQPSAFTSASDTVCAGSTNNVFTVPSVTGVTYAWSYSGNGATISDNGNSVSINFANNATSGNLTVTPSNGCGVGTSRSMALVINSLPTTPSSFITSTSQICAGDSDVIYTVASVNGVSYIWTYSGAGAIITNNGNSASVHFLSNAAAGTLTVVASNSCGDSNPRNISITLKPNPIAPIISALTNPICAGQSTALFSNVSTVTWYKNGSFFATGTSTPTINTAGTYTAINTTACGSATSNSIVLVVNAIPTAPVVNNSVSYCSGTAASNLTATGSNLLWYTSATGGNGSNIAPSPNTTVVGATNYYVSQSTNNCESPRAQITVTTNQTPPTPVITAVGSTSICSGSNLFLSSSSAGNNTWSTGETVQNISVNAAGSYTVTVSIGSCSATSQATVVTENPVPTISTITSSNPSTCVASDGFINIQTSSANTSYLVSYLKDGASQNVTVTSDNNSQIIINNLSNGNYTNFIVSNNGCSSQVNSTSISLNFSSNLSASISNNGSSAICAGDSTVLVCSTGNYQYQWMKDGNALLGQNSSSIVITSSGNYSIMITDNFSCSAFSNSIQVDVNAVPVVNMNAGNVLCNGGTTNVIVSATSGTQPYSGTGSYIASAGIQNYVVSDANGCSNSGSINITEPAVLVAGTTTIVNSTCALNNGVVTINNASGGTQPYEYSFNNSTFSSNPQFTNLLAGNYVAIVRDVNGCSASINNISITTTPQVTMNAIPTDATCNGDTNGSISIIALGGTSPLVYQVGSSTQASNIFNNLGANTYLVTVTDAMNCTATSTVTVNEPAALSIGNISGSVSPLEQSNEWYSVSNTTGINYQWNVLGGSIVSGQNTDSIEVVWGTNGQGSVQAIGYNQPGCVDTVNVVVAIQSTVGIQAAEGAVGLSIQILPNPNNGSFEMSILNVENKQLLVSITDMLGQLVLSKEISGIGGNNKIEVTGMSKGIYLASVKQNHCIFTKKIVVE